MKGGRKDGKNEGRKEKRIVGYLWNPKMSIRDRDQVADDHHLLGG